MMKVQYAYYYSDEYGVYFIRRIDGESLERHIPKGLYDLCYEEFSRNNGLAVAFSQENKVVYFFCKTEAGLQRRLQNLLFDRQMKNSHWPYADKATAEHLRYPKA